MSYVEARQYTSAAEMIAAAAAIKKSFYGRRVITVSDPVEISSKPKLSRMARTYDAHVKSWRSYVAAMDKASGSPIRAYITRRAADLGVTYEEMVGPGRCQRLAKARFQIMWEIKSIKFPETSLPKLGRLFGGRDHTTVLHALKSYEAMMGGGDAS